MALGGMFKGRFGRQRETGPLGLRIGAALVLDAARLNGLSDNLPFEVTDEPLPIVAAGRVDFGNGSTILRYYTPESEMLHLLCEGGEADGNIREVTFYVPLDSFELDPGEPDTDEWAAWMGENGRIGQPSFSLDDGRDYARVWFADEPGRVEPVPFVEQIRDDSGAVAEIEQAAMLFARPLVGASGAREYLLVAIERGADGQSIEAMVGLDLEPGAFSLI
jgi:hypothetical protein